MVKLLDKPSAQRRTRKTAALLAAVAASTATLFAAAPAATAAPATDIATVSSADYRSAEEAWGELDYTAHFYARSALVEGFLYTDTCVRVYAAPYAGSSRRLDYKSTSLKCVNSKVKLELEANVPGGADRILFEVRDAAGNLIVSWWDPR